MMLLPQETDKLLIVAAGTIAQKRLARGLKLNHTEATSLLGKVVHTLVYSLDYMFLTLSGDPDSELELPDKSSSSFTSNMPLLSYNFPLTPIVLKNSIVSWL